MKTPVRTLALIALVTLAGAAQAEGRACPTSSPAPSMGQMIPADVAKIESALRSGQITPYQAGQLMRKQWEMAQFQRGFLDAAPSAGKSECPGPAASGGCGGGAGGGCLSGLDLAPLGDMAKTGLQTASSVMKALKRETERLIRDEEMSLPPL